MLTEQEKDISNKQYLLKEKGTEITLNLLSKNV